MRKWRSSGPVTGFTLIELIIVIAIILILVGMAAPRYDRLVQHSKEAVLKHNLGTIRDVIDQYTLDKQAAPQSVEELAQAGYLREVPADELVVGDIAMDLASRRVRRGNREIALTARETAFLEFFLRRPNTLVRREALEDALWESDRNTASNLIEVYISRLRRKLSAQGEGEVIATVRGIGYRFGEAIIV